METKPRHKHDCERCTYLGNYDIRGRKIDLYHCEQTTGPTVIARYSSEESDYASGLPFAAMMPELDEAKRRAESRGLPTE